jgi:pimeloyl-ACP methyl ester carboxylesterase
VIDGLGGISCPTVVIVGAADLPMYVGGSRYIAERVPGAEFVEVAGAGHDPHLDRADEVTGLLLGIAARSARLP